MLPSKNPAFIDLPAFLIRSAVTTVLFFSLAALLYAQAAPQYPLISSLESKKANVVFRQFQDDVADCYKKTASDGICTPSFYRYTASSSDTLFTLSSRCSLPVESIALINHLPSADTPIGGITLYLPTAAGLYFPVVPSLFIESLLYTRFENTSQKRIVCGGEEFFFIPGQRLSGTERLYFLDSRLKSPLEQSVLTSSFGYRISPISGQELFHKGIDLAADSGSSVFACLSGKVISAAYDDIYGNYVIITHDNNLQSLYAHLSDRTVKSGDIVSGGSVIGHVGVTGLTTGPHLHFEVKQNGVLLNPEEFLRN